MIGVIVPVRNGMPWLEQQLRALSEQQCHEPWEVVVADNGSTDESRSVVQKWTAGFPMIRLVDAPRAKGPGTTRNAGVEATQSELLAFCDADDVAQPGWLSAHVLALGEADASGGAVDSWSLNQKTPPSPPSYGPPLAMSQFGFPPAAMSCNLAVRRSVFDALGGFAEDLLTGEDYDLCWGLHLAGHRYVLNTDAVVARRFRQGFRATLSRFTAYGRCGPALYRRYKSDGLRRDLTVAAKTWRGWLCPRLDSSSPTFAPIGRALPDGGLVVFWSRFA